jgi:acetamidase/formamidase
VLHAGEVEARREDALNLALLALSLREIVGASTRSALVGGLKDQLADFARRALVVELLEGCRLQVVPHGQPIAAE